MICKIQNKLLGHHGVYFMSKVNIQNTLMHFCIYGYFLNIKIVGFYKGLKFESTISQKIIEIICSLIEHYQNHFNIQENEEVILSSLSFKTSVRKY